MQEEVSRITSAFGLHPHPFLSQLIADSPSPLLPFAPMIDVASQIERRRRLRARRRPPLTICGDVRAVAAEATRTHRRLGHLIELWEAMVPREVADHTTLVALRRGVAHVSVDSASTGYELDRLLRGGLTEDLRRRFRGTLVRVKIRVGG